MLILYSYSCSSCTMTYTTASLPLCTHHCCIHTLLHALTPTHTSHAYTTSCTITPIDNTVGTHAHALPLHAHHTHCTHYCILTTSIITTSTCIHSYCTLTTSNTLRALGIDVCYQHQLHRITLVELTRIENHLLNIACHSGDLDYLLSLLHYISYFMYLTSPHLTSPHVHNIC